MKVERVRQREKILSGTQSVTVILVMAARRKRMTEKTALRK